MPKSRVRKKAKRKTSEQRRRSSAQHRQRNRDIRAMMETLQNLDDYERELLEKEAEEERENAQQGD